MFWRQGIGALCIQSLAKVGAPGLVNFITAVLVEIQLLITLIIEQITHYPVEVLRSILPHLHPQLKKAYDRVGVVGRE